MRLLAFENILEVIITMKYLFAFRSSCAVVFVGKDILKLYRKFTEERQCRSVISIKFFCIFIEIKLRMGVLL